MPHVHIRHFPKDLPPERLAAFDEALTAAVMETFDVGEEAVSISLEPVAAEDWDGLVLTDIAARRELLLKAPGYWDGA
ncbi:tautomerase family protein [Streptomyces sp. NPDC006529]|uniref:tautomerase family protein n=1 Tax=Streptomyces sp. NPDC006529 TaxID=3157177 RepID=UPI0033AD3C1F